jgi:hypothetical protein
MKYAIACFCLLIFVSSLHADTTTLTVSCTATTTAIQNSQASSSNSTQIVIQTNVTAQILHLHEYQFGSSGGFGYLMVQVNGLNFRYSESSMSTVNNRPVIIGPATITLIAIENLTSQGNVVTGQDNMICTILTTPENPCSTNLFTPNTGVVIPADSGGPVNIILESSVDLINWMPADPGTYGTTTSNRFFRVRATR